VVLEKSVSAEKKRDLLLSAIGEALRANASELKIPPFIVEVCVLLDEECLSFIRDLFRFYSRFVILVLFFHLFVIRDFAIIFFFVVRPLLRSHSQVPRYICPVIAEFLRYRQRHKLCPAGELLNFLICSLVSQKKKDAKEGAMPEDVLNIVIFSFANGMFCFLAIAFFVFFQILLDKSCSFYSFYLRTTFLFSGFFFIVIFSVRAEC
jgi:hypothetical protein